MFYQILFFGLYLEFVRSTSTAPGFYISYNVEESRAIELNYSEACQECANLGLSIAKIDDNSTFNRAKEYVTTFQVTFNWDGDLFWVDANSTFEATVDKNECTLISGDILTKETCDVKAYILCQGFIYEQEDEKNWVLASYECKSKGAELSQLKTHSQRAAAAQHITVMDKISLKKGQPNGVWFGFWRKYGTEDVDTTISGSGHCVTLKSHSDGTFDLERNGCLQTLLYICSIALSTNSAEQDVLWPTTTESVNIPLQDGTTTSSEMSTESIEQDEVWSTTSKTINIPIEDETTTSSEMSTMTTEQEVVLSTTAETINIPSEDETTTSSEMSPMSIVLSTTPETIDMKQTTTSNELKVEDDDKETAKRQQEIKEALQLNAKTTVLALNKKICAEDNRPSAVALGSVAGICVITIVLAIIIIPDLPRLWEHVTNGVPYEDKKRQKKE